MKLFHLSDLHIGLKLVNRDISEDQRYVFKQIVSYAGEQKPDAILIAGDIYDRSMPSADAVELFDSFLCELSGAAPNAEIMMISGNHDSAQRVNQYRSFLNRQHIHMIGVPPLDPDEFIEKIVLTDKHGNVNFYLLPFIKPYMVREITQPGGEDEKGLSYNEAVHKMIKRENINAAERNVLVSHQFYLPKGSGAEKIERAESEIKTVGDIDEVSGDILRVFDYAALGHLHKPMRVGGERWRYCGTPMPYSISEAGQKKGIVMVELGEKGSVSAEILPLTPLHDVYVIKGKLEDVLKQGCDSYVSIVLTDDEDKELFDSQNRLRAAFPNILETRRELPRQTYDLFSANPEDNLDMMEQCRAFLGEVSDEETALLKDVINFVLEGK